MTDSRRDHGATHVVVVGAGIVGASIACHLARLGAAVTIVEAGLPGGGATASSFAWIGGPGETVTASAPLRGMAVDEWRRLEAEVGGVCPRWSGALIWGASGRPSGRGVGREEVTRLEPALREPPGWAVHAPQDGAVDPIATTEALVAEARSHGARLQVGAAATSLRTAGGRVVAVRTTAGEIEGTTVVVAAGAASAALCATAGVELPVIASPAVLIRFRAPQDLVRGIVDASTVEVRQEADGTVLSPAAYAGESSRADLDRSAHRVRDIVRGMFAGEPPLEILSAEVGWRPMPADGEPIIGPLMPGLYVTVMHSAVTLAAAAGRLAAEELAHGDPRDALRGCRPDRFS